MATAKQRQIIYDKYDGHCAYCGCKLTKGWHIDHADPLHRKQKSDGGGYFNKTTGQPITENDICDFNKIEYRKPKLIDNGCHHPENDVIENMMPACQSCNINKGCMNIDDYRNYIIRRIYMLNKGNAGYKIAKRYGLLIETNNPVIFYFEKHKKTT